MSFRDFLTFKGGGGYSGGGAGSHSGGKNGADGEGANGGKGNGFDISTISLKYYILTPGDGGEQPGSNYVHGMAESKAIETGIILSGLAAKLFGSLIRIICKIFR